MANHAAPSGSTANLDAEIWEWVRADWPLGLQNAFSIRDAPGPGARRILQIWTLGDPYAPSAQVPEALA